MLPQGGLIIVPLPPQLQIERGDDDAKAESQEAK
jgi:hypothetical protein